ncbi:hypothetical protein MAMMFC1_00652 [Methylomusa anaerophila]|uniref:Uncharacterized protein n=1 Tax=Methylomusa anaerophila TaxID=1930071 RepID=A0A348AG10_9FIRM|nr:hypothetical protein MAMMFC1_00652 [Methylomusa anaerophila]
MLLKGGKRVLRHEEQRDILTLFEYYGILKLVYCHILHNNVANYHILHNACKKASGL